MMNIIPISSVSPVSGIKPFTPVLGPQGTAGTAAGAGTNAVTGFSDMFNEALDNINKLNEIKTQDAYDLAVGDADNLAQIGVNAQKYEVAVQLMVQMRNKILDSYQEIMRMNV